MADKRVASIVPPNKSYPREELEEMVTRWLQANVDCEKDGDWTKHLAPMYAEMKVIGASWFKYGGNYQWAWKRDFFDLGNAKDCFFQLAGAGALEPIVKEKIHRQAKGILLPGHRKLREEPSRYEKIRNSLALVKIALTGR